MACLRPPIGQPLARDAKEGFPGAGFIIGAKGNAVAVAEIKLCKVAMKVLFRAMLINTLHAAFEN